MAKDKVPFAALEPYLPPGTLDSVVYYIQHYKIQFTITRHRQSVLGDYRHPHSGKPHRISVNGNLNPYNFLITFLHELAHLVTYEKFFNKVQPHGPEWKMEFGKILVEFISNNVFPKDIETVLLRSLGNPAASSCSDVALLRVLKKYDARPENITFVEDLKEGDYFSIKGKRIFKRGPKKVKRYMCFEVATKKWFLFNGVYEVKKIEANQLF